MKIAIISGASSGIGAKIAVHLDTLGLDQLWLIGRNESKLKTACEGLSTETRCFSLDLTDNSALLRIANELSINKCQVAYLVNSAGVGYTGSFDELDSYKISNMIDLNCKALTGLTAVVLPYISMKGKIINIASGAGFLPQPGFGVYAATKSYVISFSKGLRQELKPRRISVTAVCPGPVDTEFFASLENVKEYKKKFLTSPDKVAKGAIRAANKNIAVYSPTFSMKLIHLLSKLLPTSWFMQFYR